MNLGQPGLITRIGQFASKKVQPGETALYSFCWRFKCRKGIDKGRNVGRYPITHRPQRPTECQVLKSLPYIRKGKHSEDAPQLAPPETTGRTGRMGQATS